MNQGDKVFLSECRNKIQALLTTLTTHAIIGDWTWTEDWTDKSLNRKIHDHFIKITIKDPSNTTEQIVFEKTYAAKKDRFHIWDHLNNNEIFEDYLTISDNILKLTNYKKMLLHGSN